MKVIKKMSNPEKSCSRQVPEEEIIGKEMHARGTITSYQPDSFLAVP
jgi:hypothetical protein